MTVKLFHTVFTYSTILIDTLVERNRNDYIFNMFVNSSQQKNASSRLIGELIIHSIRSDYAATRK